MYFSSPEDDAGLKVGTNWVSSRGLIGCLIDWWIKLNSLTPFCENIFSSKFLAFTNDRQDTPLNFHTLISKLSVSTTTSGCQWDEPRQHFCQSILLLLIYFKMQLGVFKFKGEYSHVFSLSSNIYHRLAEELWLSSSQIDKMIFLSHNTSSVSHTITVNSLSAQHPLQFFREYDSIWK